VHRLEPEKRLEGGDLTQSGDMASLEGVVVGCFAPGRWVRLGTFEQRGMERVLFFYHEVRPTEVQQRRRSWHDSVLEKVIWWWRLKGVSGTVTQRRVEPRFKADADARRNMRSSGGPRKSGMQSQGWQCWPPAEEIRSQKMRGRKGKEQSW
jgi:hypothetical protein